MIVKTLKFENANVEERTFEGYAAAYGNVDEDGDIIQKGAFAKSLQEAFPAGRIKVLYQHEWDKPIGMPIEMREDDRGLYVKARISKTRTGDETLELMRDGVLDRMSVGFRIPTGKSDIRDDGVRVIREGALMEFSVVTFPANEAAVITAVKSLHDIRRCAESGDLNQKLRAELLAEIKSISALLGTQPGLPTAQTMQPPIGDVQILDIIKSTLGGIAREII